MHKLIEWPHKPSQTLSLLSNDVVKTNFSRLLGHKAGGIVQNLILYISLWSFWVSMEWRDAHPCWCTSIWPSSTKPARLILKAAESKESAGWKKWVGPSRLRWRFVVSEVLRSNWNGNLAHGRKKSSIQCCIAWFSLELLPAVASPRKSMKHCHAEGRFRDLGTRFTQRTKQKSAPAEELSRLWFSVR